MKNPCKKDCPDRSPTCHAECEAYLAFFHHNKEKNRKNLMQSQINTYVNDEVNKSIRGVK